MTQHFTIAEDNIIREEAARTSRYVQAAIRRIRDECGTVRTAPAIYAHAYNKGATRTCHTRQEDEIIAAGQAYGGRWSDDARRKIKERCGVTRSRGQVYGRARVLKERAAQPTSQTSKTKTP